MKMIDMTPIKMTKEQIHKEMEAQKAKASNLERQVQALDKSIQLMKK